MFCYHGPSVGSLPSEHTQQERVLERMAAISDSVAVSGLLPCVQLWALWSLSEAPALRAPVSVPSVHWESFTASCQSGVRMWAALGGEEGAGWPCPPAAPYAHAFAYSCHVPGLPSCHHHNYHSYGRGKYVVAGTLRSP